MKLKYYLRGLGIGIIITTAVLAVSIETKKTDMTREEIIEEAEKLGMVMKEDSVLADKDSEDKADKSDKQTTEQNDSQEEAKPLEQTTPTQTQEEPKSQEDESANQQESNNTQNTAQQTQTLKIVSGMGSESVSKALADMGIVNYTEFNNYLIQNGYDSKLRIGEYSIAPGASYRDIAVMITSKR